MYILLNVKAHLFYALYFFLLKNEGCFVRVRNVAVHLFCIFLSLSLRFVQHQILELARDCLSRSVEKKVSSGYFCEFAENLETLLEDVSGKTMPVGAVVVYNPRPPAPVSQ